MITPSNPTASLGYQLLSSAISVFSIWERMRAYRDGLSIPQDTELQRDIGFLPLRWIAKVFLPFSDESNMARSLLKVPNRTIRNFCSGKQFNPER
jgi:hypothetical protein